MPLEFLKRRGAEAPGAPAEADTASVALPEETVAQDYQLKLYYAGKSSEGVRLTSGPEAMRELWGARGAGQE